MSQVRQKYLLSAKHFCYVLRAIPHPQEANVRRTVLSGLAALGIAAAMMQPAAAQAASGSCDFPENLNKCGVTVKAFPGGNLTLTADVLGDYGPDPQPTLHVANTDTYELTDCKVTFPASGPPRSITCVLPAGNYYVQLTTYHVSHGGWLKVDW
jgi:hypothetical protein